MRLATLNLVFAVSRSTISTGQDIASTQATMMHLRRRYANHDIGAYTVYPDDNIKCDENIWTR